MKRLVNGSRDCAFAKKKMALVIVVVIKYKEKAKTLMSTSTVSLICQTNHQFSHVSFCAHSTFFQSVSYAFIYLFFTIVCLNLIGNKFFKKTRNSVCIFLNRQ